MRKLAFAPKAFVRAREGVAAVEFAVIFPFMLLLYLGATEITQTVMASRKATLVARSISDLVAQQPTPTINATDIANILTAGAAIMAPFPTTTLRMTVTSVEIIKRPNTTILDAKPRWTMVSNGATKRPCAVLTPVSNDTKPTQTNFPSGLYTEGSIIVADVSYTYEAPFTQGVFRTTSVGGGAWSARDSFFTTRQTAYMRPRSQTILTFSGAAPSGSTVCASY